MFALEITAEQVETELRDLNASSGPTGVVIAKDRNGLLATMYAPGSPWAWGFIGEPVVTLPGDGKAFPVRSFAAKLLASPRRLVDEKHEWTGEEEKV